MDTRKPLLALLCLVLALGLLTPSAVRAQSQTSSQSSPPLVGVVTSNATYGSLIVDGLPMSSMADFWCWKSGSPTSTMGYQGELHSNANGTEYCLVFLLTTMAGYNPASTPKALYVNCSYGEIPVSLSNATSFTFKTGNCTYIDGLPTMSDNVTFNNATLNTYGHGTSTLSLTLSQTLFLAENASEVKVKIGVYANLTNTKIYLPDGLELPQGTKYSLNLQWIVCLSSWAANGGNPANPVLYNYVASGSNLYFVENNSQHTPVGVANMSLGDSFTEMQGASQEANRTATATFTAGQFWGPTGLNANCYQCFSNLTYGTTTGVLSDPTIGVHYYGSTGGSPPFPTVIVGVGVGVVAIAVIGVVLYRRKIKK